MNLTATIKLENDRLKVSGDLDFSTVVSLWNDSLSLISHGTHFVVDFSEVTSTKSAGLALLVEWLKLAKRENKKIIFEHVPEKLISIAKVCGMDSFV